MAQSRSLKSRIMRPVHRLAFVSGATNLLVRLRDQMRILMLHAIGNEHCTEDAFKAQMEWLARRVRVVPLPEVLARVAGVGEPRGEVALTFDDALRNQLTFAYPLLRRLGPPPPFFVCPACPEQGRGLW